MVTKSDDGSPKQMSNRSACLETTQGETIVLGPGCALGRSKTNQIVLTSQRASRRHALIHRQNLGEYWLVDLGSNNGSLINGRRLQQPTLLRNGDRVELAGHVFLFKQTLESAETATSVTEKTQTERHLEAVRCWLLLADIKGFSRLAREVPPSELAELVGKWFLKCKGVIESSGGYISEYLGDGLLACWMDGPSVAQEVQSSTAILNTLQDHAPRFRIALHFGDLALGRVPCAGENKLIGPNVNFAFRLEKLASRLECSFLISSPAARVWPLKTVLRSLGKHTLAGFEGEHEVYGL